MLEPGRQFNAGSQYRYGFNGKENDNNVDLGVQDYGMRIYDGRIGKFFSVDPLENKYPHWTPFQFAGDNPIKFLDMDGAEPKSNVGDAVKIIDDFAKDDRQSSYLDAKRLTKSNFVKDLKNIIADPDHLNQCNTDFCGKANANVKLALKDNPVGVANFLIDLYVNGAATYYNGKNDVNIALSDNLKQTITFTNIQEDPSQPAGNYGSNTINSAFSLMANALTEKL